MTLYLDLQDGFEDEEVIVLLNGETAVHEKQVKTRFQIGHAASYDFDFDSSIVDVTVILPARELEQSMSINIQTHPYLGISITSEADLILRSSESPFGYV